MITGGKYVGEDQDKTSYSTSWFTAQFTILVVELKIILILSTGFSITYYI